ncbi:MAG: hypothetical protein EBS29_11955, partial [Chloroflexia bacterium]|nr:hypothetical protein [Chloroflexia bacterium]
LHLQGCHCPAAAPQPAAANAPPAPAALLANHPYAAIAGAVPGMPVGLPHNAGHLMPRRDPQQNEYAALFVALIGETDNPQGVVNTTEGRVVRAFHKFTLVDQTGDAFCRRCCGVVFVHVPMPIHAYPSM